MNCQHSAVANEVKCSSNNVVVVMFPLRTTAFVTIAGVHEFFIDTKTYYSVATDIWSGTLLKSFTRKELETYQQVSCAYKLHANG